MPRRRSVLPVVVLSLSLLALSCSVQDGPTGQRAPTVTELTATVESVSPTTTSPTTEPLSSAVIEIGPASYELDAICAAGGASEVEVALNGLDINGKRVVGLVRAFEAEPYVGLQVGEGAAAVLFEPRLEGVLPFEFEGDVLEFVEVDFVTALDLATGEFVPAGIGSVRVECLSYVRELPAVPFD